jgi:tRNA nucleotidyltransferase/poly(A) polymerase
VKRDTRTGKSVASANRAVAAALRRDRPLRAFLLEFSKSVSGAGGTAFLAGGYLRDIVEGSPGGDVDLMVAGLSHRELGRILSSLPHARLGIRKVVPAGKHFPVYRVATAWRDGYVDVSTARGGGPARRLDPLAQALEDASRRDFTFNSLLYALSGRGNRLVGELFDPFGGIKDLSLRTIRCVGDAEARLREDPLRAMRALRTKSERKGFRIDAATYRAVRRLGPDLLPGVPSDRLVGELLRSLAANPEGTLEELRRSGILRALLPELSRRKGGTARAGRRYRSLRKILRAPVPPEILLANLLGDLSPRDAEAAARRLRFPNVRRVLRTLSDLRPLLRPERARFPLAETEAILERAEDPRGLVALYRATCNVSGRRALDLHRFLGTCGKIPRWIDGTWLRRNGFPDGPARGEILLRVREASLSGAVRGVDDAVRFAEAMRGGGLEDGPGRPAGQATRQGI